MDWRFWRQKRRDAELDEEIAHDLWLEAEEREASGLSRAEAERASRKDFGNVALIKEAAREAWTWQSLEILAQDIRYALRTLRRSPAFAATAIATLALGIGVNSATFTIFDQVAFRPLPVKDGSRIVSIYETFHGRVDRKIHGNIHMLSYPEFLNYQARNHVFTEVAAYADVRRLTLAAAQPEPVAGLLVTDRYFSVLGAGTALGRTFRSDEAAAPQTEVILSDGFWQRRFGGDPALLGKTIRLNRTVFTIVGIIAPGFVGTTTNTPDVWLPLSVQPQVMADLPPGEPQNFLAAANLSWLNVVGKLKPHVTATQARTDLALLASQTDQTYPGQVTEVNVLPSTFLSNPDARPIVLIGGSLVLVAVGLVLFVACANVANLLLARATARQREIAVRLSIGASRARVVRQLLTESSLLALAGGGLGLFLAQRTLDAGRRVFALQSVDLSLDVNVLWYTVLLSIVTSIMFGLLPALQATTPNLSGALKDGTLPGLAMHKTRLRSRLISAQVTVCCIFLVGAGLLVRGLMNLNTLDPGFRVKNVFVTDVDVRFASEDHRKTDAFYRDLLSRIDAQTGGESALAAVPPFHGVRIVQGAALDGGAVDSPPHDVNSNIVSRNYFDVLGIHFLQGRTFTDAEQRRNDPVAIISESMAKAYWPSETPIGQRFRYGPPGRMQSAEVVGVVNDVRSIHVASPDGPLFYLPGPTDGLMVVTRSAAAGPISKTIQAIVHQLDPSVVASVRTLEDALQHETSPTRVAASSALLLGGLALLLSAVGIYGMTAYVISQRTNEIGVRLALGARRSIILRWTLSEAMRPVAVGIAVGMPVAAIASESASKLLLGVHPLDPFAFVAVPAFLGMAALIASAVPARRAMRVDPTVALRHE